MRVRSTDSDVFQRLAEVSARIEVLETKNVLCRLSAGELRDQCELILKAAVAANELAKKKDAVKC